MLRLRKVDICGFKSFAERTRILFNGTGVAAIVGPNGCGKSNISDAILWVLGEQSAKTLRSGRMADCIFNGTAGRPPTNLAEVTLTLVNPEGPETAAVTEPEPEPEAEVSAAETPESHPSEEKKPAAPRKKRLPMKILPGEVVVTRRLYREGTSEYYLNGELCRLRDIQELFMGTGLGPESYAIIEQGRIGQILSSRPGDRRALLEEAAGVTKYKTKRRLAEAKLESARHNLLRVNDILDEITKQLNSLKRQASRARRYRELKSEGRELRRRLLATQLEGLHAAEAALAGKLETTAAELHRLSSALAELEQQQTDSQTRQYELESGLRQEQNRTGQALVELERAQTRLADARREQAEVERQLASLADNRPVLAEQAAATTAGVEQHRVALAELELQLVTATKGLDLLTTAAEHLRVQVADLEAERQQQQEQHTHALNRLTGLRTEYAQLAQKVESASEQSNRFVREREVARQEQEREAAEAMRCQTEFARARAELNRVRENVTAAEKTLASCRQGYEAEQRRVEDLRKSLAAAVAQHDTLHELVAHRAALAAPVQKLLLGEGGSAVEYGFRAVGVVGDFAELDSNYAPLLEDYLHDEMEYVVVETYDAARSGVSLLRAQESGRATFLVNSFGCFPPKLVEETASLPLGKGVIAPVANLVRLNGSLGSEAKRVLPRLARTYLVESARAAEELAREYPQFFFLATDGTCYHGRLVSGGTPNGHGSRSLQHDLEHAVAQRSQVEPVATLAEGQLRQLEACRRWLEDVLGALRRDLLARERNLLQSEQRHAAHTREAARSEESIARAESELTAHEREGRAAGGHLEELRAQLAQVEQEVATFEESLKAQAQRLQELRRQSDEHTARLSDLRAERAALEERLRAARQQEMQREENARHLVAAQQEERELETRLQSERDRLAQELLAREAAARQRQEEKAALELCCQQLDQELTALRESLVEREAALRQQRAAVDAVREQRHGFEVERARQEAERQHAALAAQSEFGLTAEQLCAQVTERLEGEELAQADTRFAEIQRRLENIGAVNMMALEELQEREQRHEFLTGQHVDLLASIDNTNRAIHELDAISREKFEQAFAAINQNFGETFRTLFGGGSATMRLIEAENIAETGIELVCQPPGKRLQNVLLLSGGEKALAALALLIAVFRYQPSPFCILDEVDAPLDDTNVGRFTQLIQQMAPQTQFILITHNKKTMEVAPILYGVTMQAAVSQIVSVRFDSESPAP